MGNFIVKKILNNNVLIANHEEYHEVVLIGKGLGFGKKKGDLLKESAAEQLFVLKDREKQEQYKSLLTQIDDKIMDAIVDAFELIRERTRAFLNEHTHIALTDHIYFTVQRYLKGMIIRNPFAMETKTLYPEEYAIASDVVKNVNEAIGIELPDDEISFITLHIHSAIHDKELKTVNKNSKVIGELIQLIEQELDIVIDKNSIDYMRLVRHLRFTIERVNKGEEIENSPKIALLLQHEYPFCYNLSWKLIKVMQNALKLPIGDAEAVYLTLHLQRLQNKK